MPLRWTLRAVVAALLLQAFAVERTSSDPLASDSSGDSAVLQTAEVPTEGPALPDSASTDGVSSQEDTSTGTPEVVAAGTVEESTATTLATTTLAETSSEPSQTTPMSTTASTSPTTTSPTATPQPPSPSRPAQSTSMEARVTSHQQGGVALVSRSPQQQPDPQTGRADSPHEYTRDKKALDESVYDIMFVQQAPLFISLIVVGAICLAIILCGILYLRCRSRARDDYLAPRKDEEKAGLDNPLSDKDILANEGLMLERHNSMLTGTALTKTDEEGWIVPLSELSEDMKKALEIQDTRF